jgi:excisionase family DNA binding protein
MRVKETIMPRTKSKPQRQPKLGITAAPNGAVMTLAETAAYLRLSEPETEELVYSKNLPGRCIGEQWRFLKCAVDDWLKGLSVQSSKDAQMALAGVWKDDPTVPEMLKEIYRQRGRPMTEDGE